MTENNLQVVAGSKIIWSGVFSILYGFGGIKYKYIRRFIGPLWMGLGVFLFTTISGTFSPWYLLYPLLLCLSLHIGYGGDLVGIKLRKRAIYGLALGISAIPLCLFSHSFFLFGIHCLFCLLAAILLGVFNPANNARDEEALIAICSTLIPLFLTN